MELSEKDFMLVHVDTGNKTGVETIGVFSPDSDLFKDRPHETKTFELKYASGQIYKVANSALLSLKFNFTDTVEEFIFERIKTELVRSPSPHIKPLREPEEGFHITFFLDESMVKTFNQRENLVKYILNFPEKMRTATTRAKMRINDLVRKEAESFKI